jgi:hypothetical protein
LRIMPRRVLLDAAGFSFQIGPKRLALSVNPRRGSVVSYSGVAQRLFTSFNRGLSAAPQFGFRRCIDYERRRCGLQIQRDDLLASVARN